MVPMIPGNNTVHDALAGAILLTSCVMTCLVIRPQCGTTSESQHSSPVAPVNPDYSRHHRHNRQRSELPIRTGWQSVRLWFYPIQSECPEGPFPNVPVAL